MIDVTGVLAAYLRDDTGLMALVDDKVFADELPEGTVSPYVLLRTVSVTPAAPPSLAYDTFAVQTDCYGAIGDYPGTQTIADTVRSLLHSAAANVDDVAAARTTVSLVGADDTYSPAIPRWVLTVDVTGRSN
jgi:hypothetical protein